VEKAALVKHSIIPEEAAERSQIAVHERLEGMSHDLLVFLHRHRAPPASEPL
jgi:hypothetical protein